MGNADGSAFYVVQRWMVSELGLRGGELAIYAIIYGYSQFGSEQCFSGGISYLCEMTGMDRSTVFRNLQSLVAKGHLEKKDVVCNNQKFCKYRAKNDGTHTSPEMQHGVAKCDGGGCEMRPKHKENIIVSKDKSLDTKPTKAEKFKKPTIEEIRTYCLEHNIVGIDPEYFFNYYEANGWVQGKGKPIKSWTACLNTWKRNNFSCAAPAPAPEKPKTLKTRIDENGQEVAYYE